MRRISKGNKVETIIKRIRNSDFEKLILKFALKKAIELTLTK